ncbi:carbohydrate deacetylase [Enterococcus faecalis]|uniref:carbohydrate deacetylase n=1 Tax=Enterococcus faecalis TaxID=1351 RepID=UPI00039C31B0|nr:carbohydrate deacetylase [Enterococcus faecalis]
MKQKREWGKMSNKKLIINADDFGYTPAVTQGIIEAHKRGVVTSTTALPTSPYFLETMESARISAPTLAIGVHLTLTLNQAKPILPREMVPSLVDEAGYFWHQSIFEEKVNLEEVYNEWDAQIISFMKSGRRPDHIDSHHNVHGKNKKLLGVALALARKYQLPLRNASRSIETKDYLELYQDVRTPDEMLYQFYDKAISTETILQLLDMVVCSEGEVFEINCHPAFIDTILQNQSGYCMPRIREVEILTSQEVKEAIEERGILLANYESLAM